MSELTNERQSALASFNALPSTRAVSVLQSCLDVPRWVTSVESHRPYSSWQALRNAAASAASRFDDVDLATALAMHPRIGEPPSAGHESVHSRREQLGIATRDDAQMSELAEGNAEYEKRFNRIFLIRAAGRSTGDILHELQRRLANDETAERAETVRQLVEIALLRLQTSV